MRRSANFFTSYDDWSLDSSIKSLINRYCNLHQSLARWRSHRDFLRNCIDFDLVPKGLRLKIRPQGRHEQVFFAGVEHRRVSAVLQDARTTFFKKRQDILSLRSLLQSCVSSSIFECIETAADTSYRKCLTQCTKRKEKKFSSLLLQKNMVFRGKYGRREVKPVSVINLSQKPLLREERDVLALGSRYSLPPSRPPVPELVTRCQLVSEVAIRNMDKLQVDSDMVTHFKTSACRLMERVTVSKPLNLPAATGRGIQSLRRDQDRVIVRADKANAVVVLDVRIYEEALLSTLEPPIYEEIPEDTSSKYAKEFSAELLNAFAGPVGGRIRRDERLKREDPDRFSAYKALQRSHGRPGSYYGLVKTHKWPRHPQTEEERVQCIENLKLRPICPGFRCVDGAMAKHLNLCLKALPRPRLSIQSPLEVLEMLKEYNHMAGHCLLLSLDVEAMYPSIPVDRACDYIYELLQEHKEKLKRVSYLTPYQVIKFLKMSIYNTVAAVRLGGRDRFFRQCQGLAMGKAYSPVVADLFMGFWENDLTDTASAVNVQVVTACRYMDDYLVLCQGSMEDICDWVAALNRKDPNIRVSHEMEKDCQLPYLDIWIRRHSTGFTTSVYRKACNTEQVVPFHSFTDSRYLRSAINSDVVRAWRYCQTPDGLRSELAHIHRKFFAGGYPAATIQSTMRETLQRIELKARALPYHQPRAPMTVSFPFFGNQFYALRRLAARIGIRIVARPGKTLSSLLCSKQKYRLPRLQESGVVYSIQCECGHLYVGETGRELSHRVREHRLSPSSAFRAHPSCNPNYEEVQILCREPHPRLRLLLESAMIRVLGTSHTLMDSPNDQKLNRNAGTILEDLWLPALHRFYL
jgi:hypothetical protein